MPATFTIPSRQPNLIAGWERIQDLQETGANPQALLANLDNFQRNVNKWVTDDKVRSNVNQGVDLYRTAYLQTHMPAGNP